MHRRTQWWRAAVAGLVLLGLGGPARADIVNRTGQAVALDGDTIRIGEDQISLDGIDAPELRQLCFRERRPFPCGEIAQATLERLLLRGPTRCEIFSVDVFKRNLGRCTVDGIDLGDHMVQRGMAIRYGASGGRYALTELEARRQRRGIWIGSFVLPANWRRGVRRQPYYFDGGGRCLIKGNIQANGSRRYYVPQHPQYTRTKIDGEKGEMWFCTEQDAKEAGWKPMPAWPPGSPFRRPDAD